MKKHLLIFGKVQGVGFRNWLYVKATKKNVHGWVKNTIKGEVEVLLIGNNKDVDEIIRQCKTGPSTSRVMEIKIQDYKQDYFGKSFSVIH